MTATTQTSSHPQTNWSGKEIIDMLICELPEANSDLQKVALSALQSGQYTNCKIYPCLALDDAFVKAIGYMSSIPSIVDKKVPTLPTLVAEGCRAIADAHQQHSLATDNQYTDGGVNKAEEIRREVLSKLESINENIFKKVLAD